MAGAAMMTEEAIASALKEFANGATIRELKGISNEEIEAIYSMGTAFYKAGNYKDAEKVFKFLVVFDHTSSRFWTAMASLRQVEKKFEEALCYYQFASFLDLGNPRPVYYAAECYVALGRKEEALDALENAEKYGKDSPAWQTIGPKAEALRALISK